MDSGNSAEDVEKHAIETIDDPPLLQAVKAGASLEIVQFFVNNGFTLYFKIYTKDYFTYISKHSVTSFCNYFVWYPAMRTLFRQ